MSETARVHVHAPPPTRGDIRRMDCPTCERRTYSVGLFFEWYGWDVTCLACGEEWQDGERAERPFAPKWRERNKEAARVAYRAFKRRPHD